MIIMNEDWKNKNISEFGTDLSFAEISESERTKHVHRLHPYLGKFIPQLVNAFVKKNFKADQWILDPFMGSGTTLLECNTLGINAIGIELSVFNTLIAKTKMAKYDIIVAEHEIIDILNKTKRFVESPLIEELKLQQNINSTYLKTWFAKRALEEIIFYKNQIAKYKYQDLITIILCRAMRSARLIPHYDLARPIKPVTEKYWCIKHKRYCYPTNEALKFINRYSYDTIKRLKEFDKIRTSKDMIGLQGDSRSFKLERQKIDGIFTSPPYVGLIDYHEQHKYAYELFGFKNNDKREIGPMSEGKSKAAKEKYINGITEVFLNCNKYLKDNAKIFIVVNDKDNLYLKIGERCGYILKDIYHRPVLNRTERDNFQFTESIYYFEKVV